MNPCPKCGVVPWSYLFATIIIEPTGKDEVVACGSCGTLVGRIPTPRGVTGAMSYARWAWETCTGGMGTGLVPTGATMEDSWIIQMAAKEDGALIAAGHMGIEGTTEIDGGRSSAVEDVLGTHRRSSMNLAQHKKVIEIVTANLLKIDAACGTSEAAKYTGERLITPNLGLVIPGHADVNWHIDLGRNFQIIDSVLGGIGLESLK